MLIVVDYGMGNLGSIINMLNRIGIESCASAEEKDIESAEKLILPGVGAFDSGMRNLLERNLVGVLNRRVIEEKIPILGICLGMQLMTKKSQEGSVAGLGWFDAMTKKIGFDNPADKLKIPHMGWNSIQVKRNNSLFDSAEENTRFYFLHSYYVECNNKEDILATTSYGYDFPSVINRGNIYGVQFHPEKSHKFGMKLMENFAKA